MNRWQCQFGGCRNEAIGVGGAIGLRAIGWYYAPGKVHLVMFVMSGPTIYCPEHRPDASVRCRDNPDREQLCSLCTADQEVQRWQQALLEEAR